MLSHRNMLSNVHDAPQILPLGADDVSLSFLPLSHGFERTTGLYTPLSVGGSIAYGGGTVSLLRDLAEVRPTLLCCVPRVLELVYRRVLGERESAGFAKRQLLDWALALGRSVGTRRVEERTIPPLHQLQLQLIDRHRVSETAPHPGRTDPLSGLGRGTAQRRDRPLLLWHRCSPCMRATA